MVSVDLLNIVMLIELGLLALAVALFFAHGVWLSFTQKRLSRLTGTGRDSLARLVTRGTVNVEEMSVLQSLPKYVQVIAFLEISRNLTGTGKERLRFVAQQIGVIDRARSLCVHRRWQRRLRGARVLSQLDVPDPLVLTLLGDEHPAVRAQAAEWAASQPSVPVISAMLSLLADPATQARFAVQNALLRMGRVVAGPLGEFLESQTGRAAEAGLRVAESLAAPSFDSAALRLSQSDDVAIRVASARLLGAIGDAQAAERLSAMIHDDEARVRAAVAQALGRMQHWQAGSLLAEALRDRTWRVRREAGLALRSIGAAGALFLRRALKSDDRFAADMAQQVLDLPEAAAG
ncbi:MAG TPA: HEAT repeat domain-containing protein [Gemmatimonadaceae bacterium]|jgi:HEAT repeat protein|nr:HEAT repeat domain-containing protein [Gemmatimonadaceae bacterium]